MNREEFYASLKKYKEGPSVLMHAEEWEEEYLETAAASLAKASLAMYVGETEDAEKFQHGYMSCIEELPDDEEIRHSVSEKLEQLANEWFDEARSQFDGIIEHGTKWKDHKYIRIENGRYIYEDPRAKANADKAQADGQKKTGPIKAYMQKVANLAGAKAQADGEKKTVDIKRGMADNAIKKYQEDGMKRTVVEEQKKAAVDKQKTAAAEVRKGDNSEKKADNSMAGYDAWKKLQAQKQAAADVRKGDDSARRAEEEGKAQDAAKSKAVDKEISKIFSNRERWNDWDEHPDWFKYDSKNECYNVKNAKDAPEIWKNLYSNSNGFGNTVVKEYIRNKEAEKKYNDDYWDKVQKEIDGVLDKQDKNFSSVKTVKHSFDSESEFRKAVIAYKTSH